MHWLAFILSFFAGSLVTMQTGSNSEVKKVLGLPVYALISNYVVGALVVFVYALIRRVGMPPVDQIVEAPWWAWLGGLFGAIYGLAAIFFASQLGAATLTALVVTGQLICAVVLDHFGWMSFEAHPINAWRIVGCVLMITGLVLLGKF